MNQLLIIIPLIFGSPQEAPPEPATTVTVVHEEHHDEHADEHADETPEEHAKHEAEAHEEHEHEAEAHEEVGGHPAHGEGFQGELVGLLRNPAHWVFEWINDLVSWIIIFILGRAYVKYRERLAVKKHDAEFHPHSHRVDGEPDGVVE